MAYEMFNNPLTVLGAAMMQGFDPQRQGLGGLGTGMLAAGQQAMAQENLEFERARAAEEQERVRQLTNMQMQQYQAKLAQQQAQQEAQEGLAERYPQYSEAIRAGFAGPVIERELQGKEGIKPYSQMGRLAADVRSGLITQEQADAQFQASIAPEGMSIKDLLGQANALRDDFQRETAGFSAVKNNWESMKAAGDNPLGDVTRTFAYMKILDPTSTVREGEVATVDNAGGISASIMSLYNNALLGKGMSESKRKMLEKEAGNIYNQRLDDYKNVRSRYQGIGRTLGISPEQIAPVREYEPYQPEVMPQAGILALPQVAPEAAPPSRQGRKARREAKARNVDALLEKYK